jgi:hypothetical protein
MAKKPLRKAVKFSAKEESILQILKQSRQSMTVEQVADAFYKHEKQANYYWREIVGGLLRSVQRKCEFNRDGIKIAKHREDGEREVRWMVRR